MKRGQVRDPIRSSSAVLAKTALSGRTSACVYTKRKERVNLDSTHATAYCIFFWEKQSNVEPQPLLYLLTIFGLIFYWKFFQSWSGESSPSTSPRGSSDSGISSSGIIEEIVLKNPESPAQNFSASDTANMFIASNPFAGLSMVAAAMAAVSNSENLQTFNHFDAGLNLSTSQQQHSLEDSSPETPPKHNGSAVEDRDVRNKAVKSEKVMHSCPHCNFTTVMSQHMKSHLVRI